MTEGRRKRPFSSSLQKYSPENMSRLLSGSFPGILPAFPPEPHVQFRFHEPPVLAELEGRYALLLDVAIERPRRHFQVAARLGGGQHLIPYRLGHRTFRMIRAPSYKGRAGIVKYFYMPLIATPCHCWHNP